MLDLLALISFSAAWMVPEPQDSSSMPSDKSSIEYKKYQRYYLLWDCAEIFGLLGSFIFTIILFILALVK